MAVQALNQALNTVPYLAGLGITVARARPGECVLSLPLSTTVLDHRGHVHPSALFALGEAAAGVALGTSPDLVGLPYLQKAGGIKYLAAARTPVTARAALDPEQVAELRAALITSDRVELDLVVKVRDQAGVEVAEVVAVYTFRAP